MKQYRAKNGNMQFKPSIAEAMEASANSAGFCLACGAEHDCIEPDARKYHCTDCGAHKVYGADELILMGLIYD